MTNLEKMNQLVGTDESEDVIIRWAYMNRVLVGGLDLHTEFSEMSKSVSRFMESDDSDDEVDRWKRFLSAEYVEEDKQ